MKPALLVLVLLLSACSSPSSKGLSDIEIARFFLEEVNDVDSGLHALDKAMKTHPAEASVLKAQIILKSDYENRHTALPLVAPYVETNAEAALIYGLINYRDRPEYYDKEYYGFLKGAQLGHPTAMHYLAGHYHHIRRNDETAIKWALKSMAMGCAQVDSYIYIMDLPSWEIYEELDNFKHFATQFNNPMSRTYMMVNMAFFDLKEEFDYWKRQTLWSKEDHAFRKETILYDLYKDCYDSFVQDYYESVSQRAFKE